MPMRHWYNIVTVKSRSIGKTTYWITATGKFNLIKPFTVVIYYSRVVLTRKLPILRLYGHKLCSENVYKIGYWKKIQFKRNEVIFKWIWYITPLKKAVNKMRHFYHKLGQSGAKFHCRSPRRWKTCACRQYLMSISQLSSRLSKNVTITLLV